MKIKGKSFFSDAVEAERFLETWAIKVQDANGFRYMKTIVDTALGKTIVWTCNAEMNNLRPIVFFPGARTCGLFWDMDNALQALRHQYRLYIVEVNGQPSLSDGYTPDISTDGYGVWASEVLSALKINNATVVGGGLICMKLCLIAPHLVEQAILMNPAGIQAFSFSFKNLYYNFLPIIKKDKESVKRFLEKAIFHAPVHNIPEEYKQLMIEYQAYVLNHFNFKGDYPSKMRNDELNKLKTDIHLVLGDKDILFPYKRTIEIASKHISSLKGVKVLADTAHGIETSREAIRILLNTVNKQSEITSGKPITH